jgi:hypothetical protein
MIELEFRNVDFCGGRKTGEPEENDPRSKGENQHQTQLTRNAHSRGAYLSHWSIFVIFVIFVRVRTKFTVVDQESEALQVRSKTKKVVNVPKQTLSKKDLTKSMRIGKGTGGSLEGGNAGTSGAGNDGIIYTQTGGITPLPPPLVSKTS